MLKKQTARWNLWQSASTNRRIFSGMLVVAVITLMVKFVSAAKELVVADYFGTGDVVDAFLFAFLLPSFAINVLSGSFSAEKRNLLSAVTDCEHCNRVITLTSLSGRQQ